MTQNCVRPARHGSARHLPTPKPGSGPRASGISAASCHPPAGTAGRAVVDVDLPSLQRLWQPALPC